MLGRLKKIMNDSRSTNVLLYAAGMGTRLRPATIINPKPTIPLFGIPLGFYLLPYVFELAVSKFVVNTFHLPEKIHDCYNSLRHNIQFSDETNFIKGSGGGLKQAEKYFDHSLPIVTANADEVLFTNNSKFLTEAYDFHKSENALATLIVMNHPEAGNKFGAIWAESHSSNKVISIGKTRPTEMARAWHFVGVQILSPEIFSLIETNKEQNIFYDVLIKHLNHMKVQIFPVEMDWYELGNLSDYDDAKKEISKHLAHQNPIYTKHFTKLKALPHSKLSDLA